MSYEYKCELIETNWWDGDVENETVEIFTAKDDNEARKIALEILFNKKFDENRKKYIYNAPDLEEAENKILLNLYKGEIDEVIDIVEFDMPYDCTSVSVCFDKGNISIEISDYDDTDCVYTDGKIIDYGENIK